MCEQPLSATDAAQQLAAALESLGQEYALGGTACLAVFKMMFFRRKDVADVEQMLRTQLAMLDHAWVRQQLVEILGQRDPRVTQWDELVAEVNQ